MPTKEYMVISPHTREECMAALDAAAEQGPDALAQWRWGCAAGDHAAYGFIQAASSSEALESVPEELRARARAVEVTELSEQKIESMHAARA